MADIPGIDPKSWHVTILTLPKRFTRGKALGFCGGHVVGLAETGRARVAACWWPEGRPELLALEGRDELGVGNAAADVIPGNWRDSKSGALSAVVWRLREGALAATELHDSKYAKTWARAAGGGAVVGVGSARPTPGQFTPDVGLVWRESGPAEVIAAAGEVSLFCTDGTRVAGSVQGRATLWPSAQAAPVDLTPDDMGMGEVHALDGELQVGVTFKRFCPRAALWRGTVASFVDLTPEGFEAGHASGAAGGWQVGFVRAKDEMPSGGSGYDNRAALWHGDAGRWLDLNRFLPSKYNSSVAWAIELRAGALRICGSACRVEKRDPGTPHESHILPVEHPALWTARLS